MSFFTDFVIAPRREAKKVPEADDAAERWPGVSGKNIMCLDAAALYGLMTGVTDPDGVVALEDQFEYLFGGESVEVRLFPEGFTRALAALAPAEAARLADRWRAIDECGVSGWEPAEVRELLDGLRDLAGRAVAARRPVLLRVSGF